VVVRILWVVSGEVWYVVIVLVFVRGSKWVSCVEERMMGSGLGEGEREDWDSKSERSNQSLLEVRNRRWGEGTFEVWMSLWRRLVRRGGKYGAVGIALGDGRMGRDGIAKHGVSDRAISGYCFNADKELGD